MSFSSEQLSSKQEIGISQIDSIHTIKSIPSAPTPKNKKKGMTSRIFKGIGNFGSESMSFLKGVVSKKKVIKTYNYEDYDTDAEEEE